jgi:hypothetical protein
MDPSLRRSLYMLMLVGTVGTMTARVANVELLYEPSVHTPREKTDKPGESYPARKWPDKVPAAWPTFGSNDRARWATVKALVEEGTFVIGRRVEDPKESKGYRDEGIGFTDGFKSVDIVLHPDRKEFYATKPPLFTVLVAGEYWLLHKVLKWDLSEKKHRWEVVVTCLLTFNVLPLAIALWLLSRLLERYGTTDWGRLFTFAVACWGTFLTTFAVTLSNHVPAACCIFFAVYALLGPPGMGRALLAGLFAGMAVCLDLPSAAFAGVAGLVILLRSPRDLIAFIPALLVPVVAQTVLNYVAVGTWIPVYAQFGGPWYEYQDSHWEKLKKWREGELTERPPGIDFIDEPKHVYAFHLLFGHHGLFSLTPVWLLAVAGFFIRGRQRLLWFTPLILAVVVGLYVRGTINHDDWTSAPRWLFWLTPLLFLAVAGFSDRGQERLLRFTPLILAVVVGFYIYRTNNYGGWTSGPRWLFWLTPLLLLALMPVADWLSRSRFGRGVGYIGLAASIFSATYPWANPWRHPWIYQWCEYMDWVHY